MFKSMRLSVKLISAFVLVAVITLAVGGVGYWGVSKLEGHLTTVGGACLPSVDNLRIIAKECESIRVAQRTLLVPSLNNEDHKRQFDNLTKAQERYDDAKTAYEALPHAEEEMAVWRQFVPAANDWVKENDVFLAAANELATADIRNPMQLLRDLAQFRGDHYKLEGAVCQLVEHGVAFEGGDDATACGFGKWMASFKTANPEFNRLLSEIRSHHDAFHGCVKKIRALVEAGDKEGARNIYLSEMEAARASVFQMFADMQAQAGKVEQLYSTMNEQAMTKCLDKQRVALEFLDKLITTNEDGAKKEVEQADVDAGRAVTFCVAGLAIGFVVALLFGIVLSSSITRSLNQVIQGLSTGSEQVNSAAGQVSQSSQEMAEGASEQASSLEEISASLEEMTSMTRQNADNATQANSMSGEASTAAQRGRDAMGRMSDAIGKIKASSDETAKIIKTIDEIAFQTNLLALNAAVEAARAGDAGKGFAVVAEEVRNLAQRSAEAARNTSELIEQSQQNADNGVTVSTEVAEILSQIAERVQKVTQLVGEVTSASNEQAQGIDQVTTAVAQLDQVTQANAANSEEAASASEELSAQAAELNEMVNMLVGIVGGASGSRSRQVVAKAPPRAAARVAAAPKRRAADLALHKKPAVAAGKQRALPPAHPKHEPQQKVVKPEDVIPLDDEDMGDF